MNFKKLLSAVVAGTMVLGTMTFSVYAEEETSLLDTNTEILLLSDDDTITTTDSELTTLENIPVEAIVQEGTSTDGFEVWNPGKRDDGNSTPAADAKYGTVDGKNVFIVWRYRNDMPNPLITAQVKINGTIYNTVIDMSYCNNSYGGFCTSQNTTQKLKIETGVDCKNLTNFFYSNHGCKTVDIPANIVKDLNFASNLYWAYYNEDISDFAAYTPKTEITNYTQDRIVLHGANMKVKTISFYNSINDKNTSKYTKKNICAWYYLKVDPNGGTFKNSSEVYSFGQISSNTTITDIPTNGDYIFTGWDYSAEWHDDDNGNTIKTATLKANWAEPHIHEYSSEITTEPTCTEQGIRTYTCDICNYKYTEPIEALGHDFNEEDTCIRCGTHLEAKIGDTKYATLQDAIDAANNGDTIVLINDIYTTSTYNIGDSRAQLGKTITIDLNGKTVTGKCSGSVLSTYYSVITIKDTVGGGLVYQNNNSKSSAVYASNSTLYIESGKYFSKGENGAVHATNSSKVYISNSVLEGDGGNVAVIKGNSETVFTDVTLNALFNYTYNQYSDGIWVQEGKLKIESGTYNGSVISYSSGSDIIINNGTFNGDTYTYRSGNIAISGGTFSNNVKDYVINGYYQKDNGDNTYTVLPAESKVIDTAKTAGAEITLDDLHKNAVINPTEDATYKVIVESAPTADIAAVNKAIEESKQDEDITKHDNNAEKAVFDISVVKVTGDGAVKDLGGNTPDSIKNQQVTITLSETPDITKPVYVYHVDDSGEASKITTPITVSGNKVSFTATSFSTYAVTYTALALSSDDITENVSVVFERIADTSEYNIVVKALDTDKTINRLMTADLTFKNDTTDTVSYTVKPAAYINLINVGGGRYEFNFDGVNYSDAVGSEITIGSVEFEGYGTGTFSVDDAATTNVLHTATESNNIVRDYIAGGAYNLNLAGSQAAYEITVPQNTLTVNVKFNNKISDQKKAYQNMKAVISGGDLTDDITVYFGTDETALTDDTYTFTQKLTKNRAYTVTISGAGYRTARHTVTMNADKTLSFWNNVNDNKQLIETVTGATPSDEDIAAKGVTKSFLAGDIVMDNNINIYDLSAVVSYFGETGLVNDAGDAHAHARYDLNRDGVIDSKDVAYVLVSWNN